jgi:hypothetical protein
MAAVACCTKLAGLPGQIIVAYFMVMFLVLETNFESLSLNIDSSVAQT